MNSFNLPKHLMQIEITSRFYHSRTCMHCRNHSSCSTNFSKVRKYSIGITLEKLMLECIEACFQTTAQPLPVPKLIALARQLNLMRSKSILDFVEHSKSFQTMPTQNHPTLRCSRTNAMDITFRNRTEYGIINSWKNATS